MKRTEGIRVAIEAGMSRRDLLLGGGTLAAASAMATGAPFKVAQAQQPRPATATGRQLPTFS